MKEKISFTLSGLLMLVCYGSFAQQIVNHTATFSASDLNIQQIVADNGVTYDNVTYGNLPSTKEIGKPRLPVQYINFIVPRDVDFSKITVINTNSQNFNVNNLVYPAQYPIPTSEEMDPREYMEEQPDTPPMPFVEPDPVVYNSSNAYPGGLVEYVREGYYDGYRHIITVAVHPVQYHPLTGVLDFYSSIEFTVEQDPNGTAGMQSIGKHDIATQSMYDDALTRMVANPADIPVFYPPGDVPDAKVTSWSVPFYEYVVITSKDLIPAYQELIGWKRRKGINAGIVDVNDIYSDPSASMGDQISGINDNAGKIRQYLFDAYSNGLVWAVLGGDQTVIPIRYAAGVHDSYNIIPGSGDDAKIPSDLYFSDFNGDWDVDGLDPDGVNRYGEPYDDNVDFMPEIYVGRMLVTSELEVKNQVYKILRYERDPGRGDHNYVLEHFFTQADQMRDQNQAGSVSGHFSYSSGTIWDEQPSGSDPNPTSPSATMVVYEMTQHYGLVSLFGHGSPNNIAVATSGYNGCNNNDKQKVTCLDIINGWCAPTISGNGLDNLDDFNHVQDPYMNYPYYFYSIACETTPYDNWLKNPGDPDLGEVYTKYSKGGVFAYMGNTRYGWVSTSYNLFEDFADQLTNGNYHIGMAHGLAKAAFYDDWDIKTNVLLGCPETEIWTGDISTFEQATISPNGSSVTVNTGGVNAKICVMSALDNGQTYFQVVNNTTGATFNSVPSPYAVCITAHNYLPYLWKQNVYIQNHNFGGVSYIAADNINSGENVDPLQASGITTVLNSANVIFDAEYDVILDKGFEVQLGGWFEAK